MPGHQDGALRYSVDASAMPRTHRPAQLREHCGHVCNIEKPQPFNRISIEFMKDPAAAAS